MRRSLRSRVDGSRFGPLRGHRSPCKLHPQDEQAVRTTATPLPALGQSRSGPGVLVGIVAFQAEGDNRPARRAHCRRDETQLPVGALSTWQAVELVGARLLMP